VEVKEATNILNDEAAQISTRKGSMQAISTTKESIISQYEQSKNEFE
jgi:hypothetical protein